MIAALRVLGRAFVDAWDALVLIAVLNLTWLGLSLLIVSFPPATAALFETTRDLARGSSPTVRDLLQSARRHFWRSWAWALLNVAVGVVLAVNVAFYGSMAATWSGLVQGAFIVFAVLWLVSQLLVWPFVFAQEEPRLRQAVRNAVFMVFAAPLFALTIGVVVVVLVLASLLLVIPFAVFTAAFVALLANLALLDRLRAYGKLPIDTMPAEPMPPEVERTDGSART